MASFASELFTSFAASFSFTSLVTSCVYRLPETVAVLLVREQRLVPRLVRIVIGLIVDHRLHIILQWIITVAMADFVCRIVTPNWRGGTIVIRSPLLHWVREHGVDQDLHLFPVVLRARSHQDGCALVRRISAAWMSCRILMGSGSSSLQCVHFCTAWSVITPGRRTCRFP